MRRPRASPALLGPARAQVGLTLVEAILGIAVLALVTVGLNQLSERFADDTRGTVTASQLRAFGEAARAYIKDNHAAVQAVATATTPVLIDLPTLVAAGKLPPGSGGSNSFGQASCALVLQPSPGRLQALVVTEGGTAVGDVALSGIVAGVGGSGGGVYASNSAQIRGAAGGWALATTGFDNQVNHLGRRCDGSGGNVRLSAGHPVMALWFENGDTALPFVARDAVPGRPELNAMNTPLVMNAARTAGAACGQAGAIAQDGSGKVLSCQGGAWKLVGDGACVYTTSDLNALQQDGRCYNGAGLANSPAGGEWVFVEVHRHVNQGVYYVLQRVMGMTGSALGKVWMRTQNSGSPTGGWSAWWQQADPGVAIGGAGPGTISASSTITSAGTVQGAALYASGSVTAASNVSAGGAVLAGSGVYGGLLSSSGDVQAAGSVVSSQNAINYNGTTYNVSNDWAFFSYAGGWGSNSEPGSGRGSAHLNDVYLRSKGLWASQLVRGSLVLRAGAGSIGGTSVAYCGGNETIVAGSCWAQDTCSGFDSSMHGGYPSGNAWVCPGWGCNTTYSFATCMN